MDRLCAALFLTHTAQQGDDNLALVRNRLLKSEADLASLLELYGKLRAGKGVADDETNPLCGVLKLSGVAKVEGGRLVVRNRIYGAVFDRRWVAQHMPDAELRRQRAAFQRGLLRASAIATAVVGVMAGLVLVAVTQAHRANQQRRVANQQRRAAEAQRMEARRNLYGAQMALAQQSWVEGNVQRAQELLDAWHPTPGQEDLRGFEWRYLWRLFQGDALFTSPAQQHGVTSVAFSPDGKTMATGDSGAVVKLWDVALRREVADLKGHAEGVASVGFSPDGKTLASGSWDGTVKLWDVAARRGVATLRGHMSAVSAMQFSPDGKTLASGGPYGTATLWDVGAQREEASLQGHGLGLNAVAFTPDGKTLATGDADDTIKLWDVASKRVKATIEGHGA